MFLTSTEYLNEIRLSITNADFSLASRRILDFLYDYNLTHHERLKVLSYQLRQEYLEATQKENASVSINLNTYQQWLDLITKISINEPNPLSEEEQIVFNAHELSKVFTSNARSFKLEPMSMQLRLGELTAVVGENGNGKTTLLRLISGELAATTGDLHYYNKPVEDWYALKSKIAYIPQRPDRWYGTLIDNLHFVCSINGVYDETNEDYVNYILHRLGLYQFRYLKWTEISSGYRLRFELAKALMMRPKLLVLDEPLANLDINAQQLFLQDLKYLSHSCKHPMAVVLSSQQLHELERNCKNVIFIKQGKTIYSGKQQEFANNRNTNAFELGGHFNILELQQHLQFLGDIKISDSGTVFIVNTPIHIQSQDILKAISDKQIPVNYFRDISKSTRQLFQKDI